MKKRIVLRAGGLVLGTSIGLFLVQTAAPAAEGQPQPFPTTAKSEPQQQRRATPRGSSRAPVKKAHRTERKTKPVKRSFTAKLRSLFGGKPRQPARQQKIVQTAAQESEIQRQLRLLYEKNGKQMPSMDLPQTPPNADPSTRNLQRPGTPKKKPGLLNRIFPFTRKSTSRRRTQPRYQPKPIPIGRRPVRTANQQRTAPAYQQSARVQVRSVSQPREVPRAAQPERKAAPFARQPVPPAPKKDTGVPFLGDEPKPMPKSAAAPTNSLENPFPEGSEAEADAGKVTKENPFTGLKLDDPKPVAPKPASSKSAAAKPATPAKQPAVAKPEVDLKIQPRGLKKAEPVANSPRELKTVPEPAAEPPAEIKSDPHQDKLQRIAARVGRKGLKGFCPIALRDHRDLVDAKPSISSVYKGKTYYFSSTRAKALFDDAPEKYSPAMSCRDVVKLALNNESIEGSLDHAVWFKDRLYLFAGPETLEAFVSQPKRFAVPAR